MLTIILNKYVYTSIIVLTHKQTSKDTVNM
jgi:hypothetical protein